MNNNFGEHKEVCRKVLFQFLKFTASPWPLSFSPNLAVWGKIKRSLAFSHGTVKEKAHFS